MNKLPSSYSATLAFMTIIQVIFIVIGIVKHDYFYLAVSFVLNSNTFRVVNYQGEEKDD